MSSLAFVHATLTLGAPAPRWLRAEETRSALVATVDAAGAALYGTFAPQFGLASDQCVVMAYVRDRIAPSEVVRALDELDDVLAVEARSVTPTSRPTSPEPPTSAGVYVHRWFDLPVADVDEAVALSTEAWVEFEDVFDVEVIGFFRTERPRPSDAELMLLNWYPTLTAWEESRDAGRAPNSFEKFVRRGQLAHRSRAISTTLVV